MGDPRENPMQVSWTTIGHVVVGTVISAAQAIAMADADDAKVVMYCHVVAIVVAQLGANLGVWQVSQVLASRRELANFKCVNCGKSAVEMEHLAEVAKTTTVT
jgi:hypothetical protein